MEVDPWTRRWRDLTAATRAAEAVLQKGAPPPPTRDKILDGFLYDETLDKTQNLAAWHANFAEADSLPPLFGALILARSWRISEPVQRQAWLAPSSPGFICEGAAGQKRIS